MSNSDSADVNPGDLSFGDECQFIQDSSLGNSTILLAQPTNQGFVAFTAEGLATAGSFLLGSLAGSGVRELVFNYRSIIYCVMLLISRVLYTA